MKFKSTLKAISIATCISALFSANAQSATVSPIDAMTQKTALSKSCVMEAVKATSLIKLHLNLNASDATPTAIFNPADTTSFNYVASTMIYDSLGIPHSLNLYYIKLAANDWLVQVYTDGTFTGKGELTFSSNGSLTSVLGLHEIPWNPVSGAKSPQMLSIDMTCSTQYGMQYQMVEMPWQDGHSAGFNFHSTLQTYNAKKYTGNSCISAPVKPTTEVKLNVNLNATDTPPLASLDPTNPATYNFSTTITIYDSLGASYKLTLYFAKDFSVNMWNISAYLYQTYLGSGVIVFNPNGTILKVTGLDNLSWLPYSGAESPQKFSIDMTCSTQYGSAYKIVEAPWQNGHPNENSSHRKL